MSKAFARAVTLALLVAGFAACASDPTPERQSAPATASPQQPPATDPPCYSPTQNVEHAYSGKMAGCACTVDRDPAVCVSDKTGHRVALVCAKEGTWMAVEDGPCMP